MATQTDTITLYVGNRLDHPMPVTPREIADQFIGAVRDGYFTEPCGGGGEWAYRLWLTGRDGLNATWDENDEDAIFGALAALIAGNDGVRASLELAVWGD